MDEKEDLKNEFYDRKKPIVVEPNETCKYVDVCPYKEPNCFGAYPDRKWRFVCDIGKLKEMNGKIL